MRVLRVCGTGGTNVRFFVIIVCACVCMCVYVYECACVCRAIASSLCCTQKHTIPKQRELSAPKRLGGIPSKKHLANTGSAENEKNFLLGVVACSSYLRGVTWKKKNLGTCFSSFFSNDGGVTCSAFCFEGGHFSVQFLSSMWR